MIEVEVKVKADHDFVRRMILQRGAEFVCVEEQTDVYFNAPDRDFSKTDEALRVRVIDGVGEITYKGPKMDKVSKTRTEFNSPVDAQNMKSILCALGFFESGAVSKRREVYKLENFLIGIDAVFSLGNYVEVEADVSDGAGPDDIQKATESIFKFLETLGIERSASIQESYLE
ncbi:class IV adenylate cyclase [Methanolapillus ohkumae]|uniref:CYTH domain-containing protein n=1 Tax=Methanolapillus ohkumae TaxID=3028298 RepID=A0AA96V6X6_9EURY|nr:hypothetical protein MsAm2_10300 [Methanosarcinaceae archaeon Am2]